MLMSSDFLTSALHCSMKFDTKVDPLPLTVMLLSSEAVCAMAVWVRAVWATRADDSVSAPSMSLRDVRTSRSPVGGGLVKPYGSEENSNQTYGERQMNEGATLRQEPVNPVQ